ncbi:hypothetical protein ZORO111903_19750 [Zobellia roscoffensis]
MALFDWPKASLCHIFLSGMSFALDQSNKKSNIKYISHEYS